MKIAISVLAVLALNASAATLTGDKALVIPAQDIKAQLVALVAQAKPTGSAAIADYGHLRLMINVRTASGVAEVHQNADDLMIVQEGTATLVTGGSVVDPKTGDNGEIRGTSLQGGTSKSLGVGDVVIVPAGLPHQILLAPGTVCKMMVAKVKEN
jgi:mannose-6-phosphate isomerase-like protein (cupin superfamily)